jgi:hypothetical protein
MKTKTDDLTGAALDWAVAKCEGLDYFEPEIGPMEPQYSTDWAQGGPIIEREGISIEWQGWGGDEQSIAYIRHDEEYFGPTPLVAAMRCYVAARLGDEIEVPEEFK